MSGISVSWPDLALSGPENLVYVILSNAAMLTIVQYFSTTSVHEIMTKSYASCNWFFPFWRLSITFWGFFLQGECSFWTSASVFKMKLLFKWNTLCYLDFHIHSHTIVHFFKFQLNSPVENILVWKLLNFCQRSHHPRITMNRIFFFTFSLSLGVFCFYSDLFAGIQFRFMPRNIKSLSKVFLDLRKGAKTNLAYLFWIVKFIRPTSFPICGWLSSMSYMVFWLLLPSL